MENLRVYRHASLAQIILGRFDILRWSACITYHQELLVGFGRIIKREEAPSHLEEKVGTRADQHPPWQLAR